MNTISEAECALELEAMSKEDSSWHPCQVSFSSAEDGLLIEFGSQELEDMLLQDEEALTCLRFRSTLLQGDDCTHIEEGEHVLATHKSQFKSRFYDAKVEKVVRVRHSKKIYCRCTFTIKWLHQDLEGEAFTVPSNSIMKLATKSINDHPAVAVFLKSVKQMRSSCASLFPTVLEETDGEMDINKLLEKQIEDISNSAAESKEEMSKDILLEIKVDNKGHIQPNAVSVCEVSISHAQAPHGQNQLNRSTQNSSKLPINLQDKDQQSATASIQEELPENRSHLSPLAARAALASLMSTNHMRIALDGTKMFNSSSVIDMPMKDKVSSEILDDSIPVTSASDKVGNPLISTESMSQLVDLSSKITTKVNKSGKKESELTNSEVTLKCSKRERNVSQPTKAARITRSAVQKVTVMQNEGFQIETCSEEMKLTATTNKRRFTRSAVSEEKKNVVMEVKQVLEEKQSSHNRESCSPEGSLCVPESNVSKKSSVVSKKKKANSSLLDAEINIPDEERNKRQSSCEVKATQQGKVSGNSQGQKRKSTSSKKQEPPRFSPRLRYLPRTRSQGKH